MSINYQEIYRNHAADYDRLVSAEDYEGNLLPALEAIAPLTGTTVLELGVGTGRVTRLLLSRGGRVIGMDRSPAMLQVACTRLDQAALDRVSFYRADAQELPMVSHSVDHAVAGWVFGHFRYWLPERWQESIGKALGEAERIVKSGGTLIVIETLGTGFTEPCPPSPELAEYYQWLEEVQQFRRVTLRTDFRFPDVETAAK